MYGLLVLAYVFSISLFVRVWDRTYLYYAAYVLSFGVFISVLWGFIADIPLLAYQGWHKYTYAVPFVSMTIFLILYNREFLETKTYLPWLDRVILSALWVRISLLGLAMTLDNDFLYNPFWDLLFLIPGSVASFLRWKMGYRPSLYFFVGYSIVLLAFLAHSSLTRMPKSLQVDIFNFTNLSLLEILFIGIALSERFRLTLDQKSALAKSHLELLQNQNQVLEEKYSFAPGNSSKLWTK